MMSNLPDKPEDTLPDRYFFATDEEGTLHKYDIMTGEAVLSSPRFEDQLVNGKPISPTFIKGNSKFWHYSPIYKDLICKAISEGMTFKEICSRPGIPSQAIVGIWRKKYPEFDEAIRGAKQMRAEHHADNIAEVAKELPGMDKDEVPGYKAYIDSQKWLAEKNNPDEYGNRVKHSGDKDSPLTIVVNTGIDKGEKKEIEYDGETIEGELV